MLLNFLSRWRVPTRHQPSAVIVANPNVPADVETHRVQRVARQLLDAGIRHVFLSGQGLSPARIAPELPLRKLSALIQSQADAPLLICPSHQYHLNSQHVRKLVAAAGAQKTCIEFDYHDSSFLSQMGLAYRALALSPGCAEAADLCFENFSFAAPRSVLADRVRARATVRMDDQDIQAGYNAYAETTTPSTVIVELNSTCNFKCTYCPFHGDDTSHPHYVHPGQGHEMSIEDFRAIVRQVAEWRSPYEVGEKTIAPFWSGEFFLAKCWEPALRIIKEYPLRSYVCTNASVLTHEIVDQLTAHDYLDHLSISLEATSDTLNREIRRNKKYEQIVQTIDRLLDRRRQLQRQMKVALNFTIVKSNQHIIMDYVKAWAKKVDYILIGPRHFLPPGAEQAVFEAWPESLRSRVRAVPLRRVPCVYLYHTATIDCDQNLQLCAPCGSKRINIGNVKGRRILDVQSESELFQRVTAMHRDGSYMNYPYCASCSMYKCHFSSQQEVFGHRVHSEPSSWVIYPDAA
jgi:sulfatase maturation enzyme AslB (radical SAM superfamily)